MEPVETHLAFDLERLAAVEGGATAEFRVWSTQKTTVVVGRSVVVADDVDVDYCRNANIPVVRRPSGGRSVLVGPGTLQYSFVLPVRLSAELASIPGAKRFCNRLLVAGLNRPNEIQEDPSGDLTSGGRKFAGLALKRRRSALLLHGTLLLFADLATIAAALRHPGAEPAYRRGRGHLDFLTNLGAIDAAAFERRVRALLLELG